MRTEGRRKSTNIEDRRGQSASGGGKLKLGGMATLVVLIGGLLLGVEPSTLLGFLVDESGGAATSDPAAPSPSGPDPAQDELVALVSVVLADTEDTWAEVYPGPGAYRPPTLVLFDDAVQSACGRQSSAIGPFYCPADEKMYIDLTFYRELGERFGAPGDFAQAYVIAHEVGHHVQNLMGISARTHAQRSRLPEAEANALSVRQELQADCLAGVWAHHADRGRQLLESGDLEEGLRAAEAIGDDTLQHRARGHAVPETFTHGSAEQRQRWLLEGYRSGDPGSCDTFSARDL